MLAASIVLVSLVLLAFVRPHTSMGIVTDAQNRQKQKMKASDATIAGTGASASASSGVAGNISGGKRSRRDAERGRPRTSKLLSDSSQNSYPDADPESGSWASDTGRTGVMVEGEIREDSIHDV